MKALKCTYVLGNLSYGKHFISKRPILADVESKTASFCLSVVIPASVIPIEMSITGLAVWTFCHMGIYLRRLAICLLIHKLELQL